MKLSRLSTVPVLALALGLFAPLLSVGTAEAQIFDRVKETAERAAERELLNEVDRFVANAVKCTFHDLACIESAEADGEDVVLTDEDGEVMYDEEGQPVTDPSQLPAEKQPTEEANYDFEAGTDVLFQDDWAGDNVGDFPRALEFRRGAWEIVDRGGERLLRATGDESEFVVPLPETLPEQFTIEFDALLTHGNQTLHIVPTVPEGSIARHEGNIFKLDSRATGVATFADGVESLRQSKGTFNERLTPIRIMVDGSYAKMYVDRTRVANVPNAEFERGEKVMFRVHWAREDDPVYVGAIRVAAGGRDLYDVLEQKGRVAVRDIHFDSGKATIRSESAETLERIGTMLREHADLQLMIEGHTDDEGEFDANMTLSRDRAAAVKTYLVENFGIGDDRLRTMGLGSTQPVAENDTDEGRQQNRRVELVQIGG